MSTKANTVSNPNTPKPDETEFSNIAVSNRFVYRLNTNLNTISVATVDLSDGSLTDHPAVQTGAGSAPKAMVANDAKTFMYVANSGTGTIALYSIDQLTGNLTWVANKSTYPQPSKMVLHPNGQYLYTLHANNSQLTTHSIAVNGTLTHVSTSVVFSAGAEALAIDQTGTLIYASSTSWTQTFIVDGSSVPAYSGTQTANSYITIKYNSGSNRFYMPSIYGSIWNFDYDATGALASAAATTPFSNFNYTDLTFTDDGLDAYLVNGFLHRLEHYSVNPANGRLSYLEGVSLPAGCEPKTVNLLENDAFIFTSCSDGSGKTISYELGGNGSLTGTAKTSVIQGAVIQQVLILKQ